MKIMIDLETMSTQSDAAIVSIGWASFTDDKIAGSGKVNVALQSAIDCGMRVCGKTVGWWLRQSDDARSALFHPDPGTIESALWKLTPLLRDAEEVWAKPAQFDLVILRNAYRACGRPSPWSHKMERDARTLVSLAASIGIADFVGAPTLEHDAEADAIYQASQVLWINAALSQMKST